MLPSLAHFPGISNFPAEKLANMYINRTCTPDLAGAAESSIRRRMRHQLVKYTEKHGHQFTRLHLICSIFQTRIWYWKNEYCQEVRAQLTPQLTCHSKSTAGPHCHFKKVIACSSVKAQNYRRRAPKSKKRIS